MSEYSISEMIVCALFLSTINETSVVRSHKLEPQKK